jgi:hypothetical protein
VLNLQVTLERVPGLVLLKKRKQFIIIIIISSNFSKQLTIIRNQFKNTKRKL